MKTHSVAPQEHSNALQVTFDFSGDVDEIEAVILADWNGPEDTEFPTMVMPYRRLNENGRVDRCIDVFPRVPDGWSVLPLAGDRGGLIARFILLNQSDGWQVTAECVVELAERLGGTVSAIGYEWPAIRESLQRWEIAPTDKNAVDRFNAMLLQSDLFAPLDGTRLDDPETDDALDTTPPAQPETARDVPRPRPRRTNEDRQRDINAAGRLYDQMSLTQSQIAERLGKSVTTIKRYLRQYRAQEAQKRDQK